VLFGTFRSGPLIYVYVVTCCYVAFLRFVGYVIVVAIVCSVRCLLYVVVVTLGVVVD